MYASSSKQRPSKNYSGGYGDYCCIPGCKSAFYDSNREKTGIALFKLPKETNLQKKRLKEIGKYRRKGGTDNFSKNKKVMVCEFHFPPEQIKVSMGVGRKTYLPGSVPSIFECRKIMEKKTRKPPKVRCKESTTESEYESEMSEDRDNTTQNTENNPDISSNNENSETNININVGESNSEIEILIREIQMLKSRIDILERENTAIKEENKCLKSHVYNFENISKSKEEFRIATGLDLEAFKTLFRVFKSWRKLLQFELL